MPPSGYARQPYLSPGYQEKTLWDYYKFQLSEVYSVDDLYEHAIKAKAHIEGLPYYHGAVGGESGEHTLEIFNDTVARLGGEEREFFYEEDDKEFVGSRFWFFKGGFVRLSSVERSPEEQEPGREYKVSISFYTLNKVLADELMRLYHEHVLPEKKVEEFDNEGQVCVLEWSMQGLTVHHLGYAANPLERDNYSEDVLEKFDRLSEELRAETPTGRLALINGLPGSGKTYLIRALVHEVPNALFVFVPPDFIENMGDPGTVHALLNLKTGEGPRRPLILIAEDADVALTVDVRQKNMKLLQAILNLTSGIMADLLDVRLVATTNAKTMKDDGTPSIDPALLRDGRLMSHVEVNELGVDKARALYRKLAPGVGEYEGVDILGSVIKAARRAGWKPVMAKSRKDHGPGRMPSTDGDD